MSYIKSKNQTTNPPTAQTTKSLALRVYRGDAGCPVEDARLIVTAGEDVEQFTPSLPKLVDEPLVWTITHRAAYTLYSMMSKKYQTAEGNPGVLLVCLLLPANKRLTDGHSPLGVIDRVMDALVVYAIRSGKLPAETLSSAPFRALLEKYRLDDITAPLPVMRGTNPASVCAANKGKVDELMRFSRYSVLSTVSTLEIGHYCKTTIDLTPSHKSFSQQTAAVPGASPTGAHGGGVVLGDDEEDSEFATGNSGGGGSTPTRNGKKIAMAIAGVVAIAIVALVVAKFTVGGDGSPKIK